MTAPDPLLELAKWFVQCFTQPGYAHFRHFVSAHAALWGAPHCVTETLRVTLVVDNLYAKESLAKMIVCDWRVTLVSRLRSNAEEIEAEPWWHPVGPPSVTRLRRAVAKAMGISFGLPSAGKPTEIRALARAA